MNVGDLMKGKEPIMGKWVALFMGDHLLLISPITYMISKETCSIQYAHKPVMTELLSRCQIQEVKE